MNSVSINVVPYFTVMIPVVLAHLRQEEKKYLNLISFGNLGVKCDQTTCEKMMATFICVLKIMV